MRRGHGFIGLDEILVIAEDFDVPGSCAKGGVREGRDEICEGLARGAGVADLDCGAEEEAAEAEEVSFFGGGGGGGGGVLRRGDGFGVVAEDGGVA
jgi:hypothetical protein